MERESQFIGQSGAFLDAVERASSAAIMNRPVLVVGERGTGKELIAERLHRLSTRWDEPLVTMNCAALPETLIEAELFGHEAGAFTGATRSRAGRFEEADRGTLFLDELATLSMQAQERLLRAVEYGEVARIGSSRPIRVDVRIVAATNEDLPSLAERGTFRADLLDRLMHGGAHRLVLAHAEIVVRAPHRHVADTAVREMIGCRIGSAAALEVGENPVTAFGVQRLEMLPETGLVIHALPRSPQP